MPPSKSCLDPQASGFLTYGVPTGAPGRAGVFHRQATLLLLAHAVLPLLFWSLDAVSVLDADAHSVSHQLATGALQFFRP